MAELGKINRLRVVKLLDFGAYLDGGELGEILMPARYLPVRCDIDDELEVFIYRDSEDRLIATTESPRAQVGEFALLRTAAVNEMGAFMDWGLMKDLLVPFSEQKPRMQIDKSYVVRIFIDEETHRIVGSARIDDFLYRESEGELKAGDAVKLFVANRSELGYQVIVDNIYWALLHHNEVPQALRRGQCVDGFIKQIRSDNRIDACLHLKARARTDEITDLILDKLESAGGFLPFHDNSEPEAIRDQFGISKKSFKKGIGALYKQHHITLEPDGIRLQPPQ